MSKNPKRQTQVKPTVEKIVTFRATSPDGKIQSNGATEKEALALLEQTLYDSSNT